MKPCWQEQQRAEAAPVRTSADGRHVGVAGVTDAEIWIGGSEMWA